MKAIQNIWINTNSHLRHNSVKSQLLHLIFGYYCLLKMNDSKSQSHRHVAWNKAHVVTLNLIMRAEDPEGLRVGDRKLKRTSRLDQGFTFKGNLWLNLIICDVTIEEWEQFAIRIRIIGIHFMFILLWIILNIFVTLFSPQKCKGPVFYESA